LIKTFESLKTFRIIVSFDDLPWNNYMRVIHVLIQVILSLYMRY